jgi:hypothetical protein
MVGVEGFEPTTPCSQSRCATRLRYTPLLSRGDFLAEKRIVFLVGAASSRFSFPPPNRSFRRVFQDNSSLLQHGANSIRFRPVFRLAGGGAFGDQSFDLLGLSIQHGAKEAIFRTAEAVCAP